MNPVSIDPPVKPGEAGALASLIHQQCEGKRLTDDIRKRVGARAGALELTSLNPFPGSLQRDPIHPSTYYIVVDSLADSRPLLLRIAPQSSPSSGLFPNALLIGRMRTGAGAEIIVNAVPFEPADRVTIRKYAEQVDRDFFPRPQGAAPAITVAHLQFEDYRAIMKAAGPNLAAVAASPAEADTLLDATLWAAIRDGWREGYTSELDIRDLSDIDRFAGAVRVFTKFTLQAPNGVADLPGVVGMLAAIQRVKTGPGLWRRFDFEISMAESARPTTPEEVTACLEWLKEHGRPAQFIAPQVTHLAADLSKLAEAARRAQAVLTIDSLGAEQPEVLQAIGRATAGKVNYKIGAELQAQLCQRDPHFIARIAESLRS
jgi:hypothetical protein